MNKVIIATKAEDKVVHYVCQGMSNQEIAQELGLSPKTVKFHLTNIYKRNQLKSRVQLIMKMLSPEKPARTLPTGKGVIK